MYKKIVFPYRLSRWPCRRWHCPRSSSRKRCENAKRSHRDSHHVSGGALLHVHVHLHAHPHPNPEAGPGKKEPFLRPPKKPQRPFQSPAVQRYRNLSVPVFSLTVCLLQIFCNDLICSLRHSLRQRWISGPQKIKGHFRRRGIFFKRLVSAHCQIRILKMAKIKQRKR